MDDYRLMEVSGSGGGSKRKRSAGAAKEEGKKSSGLWGSESESDDDDGSEPDKKEEEDCGQSESESEDPMDPIWNLIYLDDSDGLMKLLKLAKDGNHCSGIGQKDPDYDYEQLNYAFNSACYLDKSRCLKALLDCGVDWFAENAIGEEHLLHHTCINDSYNAAQLVIAYAKKKNVADKLLGAGDVQRMTPLHVAALCRSCNVIQLLLDEGADPCKRNDNHKLPCDYAIPGTKARKLLLEAALNKL